jgi:hypothetical protein
MLNRIKHIFSKEKKAKELVKYTSLGDFMLNASPEEQEIHMREASHKANKDQREIVKKSELLLKAR